MKVEGKKKKKGFLCFTACSLLETDTNLSVKELRLLFLAVPYTGGSSSWCHAGKALLLVLGQAGTEHQALGQGALLWPACSANPLVGAWIYGFWPCPCQA